MKVVSLVISPEEDFENWVADASYHVSSGTYQAAHDRDEIIPISLSVVSEVKFQPPQMARIISVKGCPWTAPIPWALTSS